METFKTHGPALTSFYYHKSLPENISEMKGLVLILHGIEDHGKRYSEVAKKLNDYGYGVYAIDHTGHGRSVATKKEQGDWKAKDFEKSALNAYYLATLMKSENSELPLFLLGHGFGGYYAQYMMNKHHNVIEGVILSGCGKNNSRQYSIYLQTILLKKMFPDRNRSHKIFEKRTEHLNRKFRPNKTSYDWISSDPKEVEKFIIDPFSGFVGTIGFYHEYYSNLIKIPELLKFRYTPRDLPMLFVGGADDAFIHEGRDIKKLIRFYRRKKFTNMTFKLYKGARHDIFFDISRDEAIRDVVDFMDIQLGYKTTYENQLLVLGSNNYEPQEFKSKPEIKKITSTYEKNNKGKDDDEDKENPFFINNYTNF